MGHEILTYADRHAILRDEDLWAVRHFLLAEAIESRHPEAAAFIHGWECVGNGVYIGIDLDAFLRSDPVRVESFAEIVAGAIRRVTAFGELVPVAYVQEWVNGSGAQFTAALPTARVVAGLAKVRDVIAADGTAV